MSMKLSGPAAYANCEDTSFFPKGGPFLQIIAINATGINIKIKVGYDQQMAHSERNSHSKNETGKGLN